MPGQDRSAGQGRGHGGRGRERGGVGALVNDPKTIEYLNKILKNELTAINQYFLHSRMLASWGVSELSKKEYEESIEEIRETLLNIPVICPERPIWKTIIDGISSRHEPLFVNELAV